MLRGVVHMLRGVVHTCYAVWYTIIPFKAEEKKAPLP